MQFHLFPPMAPQFGFFNFEVQAPSSWITARSRHKSKLHPSTKEPPSTFPRGANRLLVRIHQLQKLLQPLDLQIRQIDHRILLKLWKAILCIGRLSRGIGACLMLWYSEALREEGWNLIIFRIPSNPTRTIFIIFVRYMRGIKIPTKRITPPIFSREWSLSHCPRQDSIEEPIKEERSRIN
jgi:hypothetical protein